MPFVVELIQKSPCDKHSFWQVEFVEFVFGAGGTPPLPPPPPGLSGTTTMTFTVNPTNSEKLLSKAFKNF